MIPLDTLARVKRIYAEKQPKHIDLAGVLAVISRESSGVAIFNDTDPLYKANLHAAARATGVDAKVLRKALTILDGELKGKVAKFRFEPSYFGWATRANPTAPLHHRILFASSVGLGQQMLRPVLAKHPPEQYYQRAIDFAGDQDEQIRWVIGNMDALMDQTTDRARAFAMYNGGPRYWRGVYKSYGKEVLARSHNIRHWLEVNHHV